MDERISLDYGSGGRKTAELINELILPAFGNRYLDSLGDGAVLPEDARLALRASVKLEHFAPGSAAYLAADYDRDREITSADARAILRVSVGLAPFDAS